MPLRLFRFLRWFLVILLVTAAILIVVGRFRVSYHDIPGLFREADQRSLWLLLLLGAVCFIFSGLLSKALLAIAGSKISLWQTIKVGLLTVLGFHVAPFVGGAVLAYIFYRKLNIQSSRVLFLMTTSVILSLLNTLLFSLAALLLLRQSFFFFLPFKAVLTLLLVLLLLLTIGYFLVRNKAKHLISLLKCLSVPVNKISMFFVQKEFFSHDKIEKIIQELLRDFDLISANRFKAFEALIISFVFYLLDMAVMYSAFFVFGYRAHPPLLIIGMTLSALLSILSLFPEAPGVAEASLITVFIGLGFPAHVSLFAVLLYRLVSYWLPMPFAFLVYLGLNGRRAQLKHDFFDNGENDY